MCEVALIQPSISLATLADKCRGILSLIFLYIYLKRRFCISIMLDFLFKLDFATTRIPLTKQFSTKEVGKGKGGIHVIIKLKYIPKPGGLSVNLWLHYTTLHYLWHSMSLTIQSYAFLWHSIVSVNFFQVKMLMFYSIQKTILTFVDYKIYDW